MISSLASEGAGWLTSTLMILFGIAIVFVGKFLLRLLIGGAFGLLFGYAIYRILLSLGAGALASLLIAFISLVVGFFLGWFIFKLAISIIVGLAASAIAISFFGIGEALPLLVIALASAIISYLLAEIIISAIVTIAGLAVVFLGVHYLLDSLLLSAIITLMLAVLVIAGKVAARRI